MQHQQEDNDNESNPSSSPPTATTLMLPPTTTITTTSTPLTPQAIQQFYKKQQHRTKYIIIFLSILSFILILSWFGQDGYSWSHGSNLVFSWHPTLMIISFLILYPNAVLIYLYIPGNKKLSKPIHVLLHCFALLFGIIALVAVFRFHNEATPAIPNMYSLHSWIGLSAFLLYSVQFMVGFIFVVKKL